MLIFPILVCICTVFYLHRVYEKTQVLFLYLFLCHSREQVILEDVTKLQKRKENALNLWEDLKDEQITKVQIQPILKKSPRSQRRIKTSLSKKDRDENMNKLFHALDTNGDGTIDFEELLTYMRNRHEGGEGEAGDGGDVSEESIREMLRQGDQEGNESMDFKEFKVLMKNIEKQVDHLDQLKEIIDKEHNKAIL